MAIRHSALGQLESTLEWASNPIASELRREGLEQFACSRPVELADRANLDAMNDTQLANFLARLGSAVGDALSPERQSQVMLESFEW